jgi:hypothetical protein
MDNIACSVQTSGLQCFSKLNDWCYLPYSFLHSANFSHWYEVGRSNKFPISGRGGGPGGSGRVFEFAFCRSLLSFSQIIIAGNISQAKGNIVRGESKITGFI